MNRFAFIVHPLVMQDMYDYAPELKRKDVKLVKAIMKQWLVPSKIKRFEIVSPTGRRIEGVVICVFLLPEQFLDLDQQPALERVLQAGRMAQEMGAKLIGLGAFTAVVGRNGHFFADKLDVAVTTGNSYTVAVAVESTIAAAKSMGISLQEAKLAVIGATGSIGKACSRLLAGEVSQITLVARQMGALRLLGEEIARQKNRNVAVETDLRKAVQDADLVLLVTSAPGAILDISDVKPGSVVVNVAKPDNVDFHQAAKRPDVLVVDGGSVLCPEKRLVKVVDRHCPYVAGIDSEKVFSCFAEAMILTFEERFEDYSIGRDLDLRKIKEVATLGVKHGFSKPAFSNVAC